MNYLDFSQELWETELREIRETAENEFQGVALRAIDRMQAVTRHAYHYTAYAIYTETVYNNVFEYLFFIYPYSVRRKIARFISDRLTAKD